MSTVTVGELTKHVDNRDQSGVMNVFMSTVKVGELTKHVYNRDQSAVMNIKPFVLLLSHLLLC